MRPFFGANNSGTPQDAFEFGNSPALFNAIVDSAPPLWTLFFCHSINRAAIDRLSTSCKPGKKRMKTLKITSANVIKISIKNFFCSEKSIQESILIQNLVILRSRSCDRTRRLGRQSVANEMRFLKHRTFLINFYNYIATSIKDGVSEKKLTRISF